jgi:SP family general alpha glucoside:H+ symporter-like MFS transporter
MLNPTGWGLVGKTGFVYLGTCFGVLVLAYFYLPELRDRTYREIDILFSRRTAARKFSSAVVGEDDEE